MNTNLNPEKVNYKDLILKKIPELINNYLLNIRYKICPLIGEYSINGIYRMNEFVFNKDKIFFKIKIEDDNGFCVVTDIYILIFYEYNFKAKGRLIFYGLLNHLKDIILTEKNKRQFITFTWNKNSTSDKYEESVVSEIEIFLPYNILRDNIIMKKDKLTVNFKFVDKFCNKNCNLKELTEYDIEKTIQFKEELIDELNDEDDDEMKIKLLYDLTNLYQYCMKLYGNEDQFLRAKLEAKLVYVTKQIQIYNSSKKNNIIK